MEWNPAILIIGASFGSFKLISRVVGSFPTPESALRNRWKWRNILTSMMHSVVTGIWAVLCFYLHRPMAQDLIATYSLSSRCLVSVSVGYFLHDFTDMLWNQKLQHSWELLFHHAVVIICFGIAVCLCRYIGFAVVALLVEINSVFLHLRQILLMANMRKTTFFRINSIINLGTYIIFRISTLAWMTRWVALNRDNIPLVTYSIGSVGMAIMILMNIVLFYRLLRSDFLKSSREGKKEKEI
ncbi:TLC domain-containing protein 2 [Hypanus sabinus]|uniref:TLC domain-containing protein 2 n=1 Tax=Hypanus sabinus TaxID=79690 RepID=UPI0028C45621|nr:TLC domain-containing protein 2 [Hypanus sabinus]